MVIPSTANHVSRETFGEFAEPQFAEHQSPRGLTAWVGFVTARYAAPTSRPADPHAVAAQERGEAPLNAFLGE